MEKHLKKIVIIYLLSLLSLRLISFILRITGIGNFVPKSGAYILLGLSLFLGIKLYTIFNSREKQGVMNELNRAYSMFEERKKEIIELNSTIQNSIINTTESYEDNIVGDYEEFYNRYLFDPELYFYNFQTYSDVKIEDKYKTMLLEYLQELYNVLYINENLREYLLIDIPNKDKLDFLYEFEELDPQKKLLEFFEQLSYVQFDNQAFMRSLTNYNFVEISRSTNHLIRPGTYIYEFDGNNDLILWQFPLEIVDFEDTFSNSRNVLRQKYYLYKNEEELDRVIIDQRKIKDYYLYGEELIKTHLELVKPSMNNVLLTELFFGTGYAVLKGLNQMDVNTKHSIEDTRVIQLILEDSSDIEFVGINMFYDLSRKYSDLKNKNLIQHQQDYISNEIYYHLESNNNNKSITDRIQEVDKLLESKVISQDEYDDMRKKILSDV